MAGDVVIERGDPRSPELSLLMARHTEAMHADTPPESIHMMDAGQLAVPGILFWVLRDGPAGSGQPVGMAALKLFGAAEGEIKSMHVLAETRGRGLARVLLRHLLAEARALGLARISLETGSQPSFAAARALYESEGFFVCPPFGSYAPDPMSTFMTRALG
ncbi:GNAT family N-acetyltransferase [Frigidibacter sp. MR17.14]|uniref:GNAT family N-acetyltransferase n=1 Tax=Frigidibacter sp. MR17.14 TaxID=3126509 RepID=UPI003012E334